MLRRIVKQFGLIVLWSSMAVVMIGAGLLDAWVGAIASG